MSDDGSGKKRMIVNITREQLRMLAEEDTEDGDD